MNAILNDEVLQQKSACSDLKFCIDWLSVNIHADSLSSFSRFFSQFLSDKDRWNPIKPKRFYNHAMGLNGQNIITVEWNFLSDPKTNDEISDDLIENRKELGVNRGILLNISGDGLRYLGSDFFFKFIGRVSDKWDTHFTRIDLACDFYNKDNFVIPLLLDSCYNTMSYSLGCSGIVSRLREVKAINNRDPFKKCLSRSAYIGTRGGRYIRIYDKCLEQRQRSYNSDKKAFDEIPDYWYRIEIEIRPSRAYEYCDTIITNLLKGVSLQKIFCEFLSSSFKVANVHHRYDVGGVRYDPHDQWDKFIADISQNDYFVEFVYLKYVGRKMSPEELYERDKFSLHSQLLMLPRDKVCIDVQEFLGQVKTGSSIKAQRLRSQLVTRFGPDFDLETIFSNSYLGKTFDSTVYNIDFTSGETVIEFESFFS